MTDKPKEWRSVFTLVDSTQETNDFLKERNDEKAQKREFELNIPNQETITAMKEGESHSENLQTFKKFSNIRNKEMI